MAQTQTGKKQGVTFQACHCWPGYQHGHLYQGQTMLGRGEISSLVAGRHLMRVLELESEDRAAIEQQMVADELPEIRHSEAYDIARVEGQTSGIMGVAMIGVGRSGVLIISFE